MGKVISIDLIRQMKRDGRNWGAAAQGSGGDGSGGIFQVEYRAISEIFDLAQTAGLVLKMAIQPYGDGFLFRAYAANDPYYTLFEIQKVRVGKFFEYHGRVRHQLVAADINFFPFIAAMRMEIQHLIDLFGPHKPYH